MKTQSTAESQTTKTSTMFGKRKKATQTHRVTFSDKAPVPNTHHASPPKGSQGSHGYNGQVINKPIDVQPEKKHPKDYHVYVKSLEKMPSTKPEGPYFPNLQLMFNQKPVYGNPGDIVHEVPVVEEKKKKGDASEKEKTVDEEGDKYQDVDGFAVEFLKKRHEFFERQRLLSMQMRT